MTNCEAYWELISAGVDGALTDEERRRLEVHLAHCPDCRLMYDQMQTMTDGLEELTTPGEGFVDSVMAGVARTEQDIPFTALDENRDIHAPDRALLKARWRPIRRGFALVACCLLAVGIWRIAGWTVASEHAVNNAAPGNGAVMDMETEGDCAAAEDVLEPGATSENSASQSVADDGKEQPESVVIAGVTYRPTGAIANLVPEGYTLAGTLDDGREYYTSPDGDGVYLAEEQGYTYWITE